jgi:hypothetical protein
MKWLFAFSILFLTTTLHALPVQIDNLQDGWMFHAVPQNSLEATFTNGSEAVINFHEVGEKAESTIFVHDFKMKPGPKLGGDISGWHHVMFPKPTKVKMISERTFLVNGQWRYVLEYKANTGTSLTSLAMMTVADGKLHVFLFEEPASLYIRLVSSVRQMFHDVVIHSATS